MVAVNRLVEALRWVMGETSANSVVVKWTMLSLMEPIAVRLEMLQRLFYLSIIRIGKRLQVK